MTLPDIDPLILVRGVHFAATVLAVGTVCFVALVAEPAARAALAFDPALRRRLTWLIWATLALAVLSGLAWLALVSADIMGASLADVCLHGGAWEVAAGTRFGEVAGLRLAVAGAIGVLMLWPGIVRLQVVLAAALIGLLALVGHAGATPGTAGAIHLTADVAHLVAAGAWLGGLPALALTLVWTRNGTGRGAFATDVTARFSALGVICVGVLVVSGLVNSWELLAGPWDLVTTSYGRLLSLKLGLFAAMLALAAVNRYRLTPRLPASGALRALTRNSLAELFLGLGVLFLVGALGTMAPGAHVHATSGEIPPDAAFVHIHTEEVMADVMLDPGHAGKTTARIRLWREDATTFSAKYVSLALEPSTPDQKSIEHAAALAPDGTWTAAFDIPQAGIWTARVIIRTGTGAPIVLDAPIVITQCSNEC